MASTIDATKPIAGNPTTDSVRVNFAAAKAEIEDLQADVAALSAGTVPDASATVKGIVELATTAEVNTGTDTVRAITPAGLEAWTGSAQVTQVGTITSGTWGVATIATNKLPAASEAAAGIVELADASETNSGASNSLAVTPAGLTAWTGDTALVTVGTISTGTWNATVIASNKLPAATTGAQGAVAIATAAEVDTGTDNTKAASPQAIAGSTRFLNRSSLTSIKTTGYSLVAGDNGYDIISNSGSALALTIPAGLAVGFQCTLTRVGAGATTIVSGTDTINGNNTTKTLNAAWSTVYLFKYTTGAWIISGDIT